MHSFRKVSARISAGGFCSVEIWVFWMDDFYEMEFYSSRIKLALLWGSGYFFVWMMNSAVAVERQACLPFPSFFPSFLARYEMDFFCLIWQECLWLDFQAWCKPPKPFVPGPSKPNHILALECLYTQVYGETFKQQWVGTDCLGFGLALLWWLILSSNFDYIICQHITIGGHFCPVWCSDKKIGNTLNNFDHINLYVVFSPPGLSVLVLMITGMCLCIQTLF